jgi:hypothetical protein
MIKFSVTNRYEAQSVGAKGASSDLKSQTNAAAANTAIIKQNKIID